MSLNIYLTRHGQDEDNVNGILNGHRNQKLTDLGEDQARRLAGHIKSSALSFLAVYCSPLERAKHTAEIICLTLDRQKPKILDLLIERNFGIMTGRPLADIERLCAPDLFKTETINYFLSPVGAETFPDLISRSHKLLSEILERHKEGNILLVTHGDIGKMIYATYYNLDWQDVLRQFHFGNSDLLILSPDSKAEDAHVFKNQQFNP
ncbi:MAG: histidine phosphatase family protein [Candidatus Falkowbacteria bacterium]